LRKTFDDDARQPTFIETIPKSGYRLLAPVGIPAAETRVVAAAPSAAVLNPSVESQRPSPLSRWTALLGKHRFTAAMLAILAASACVIFLLVNRSHDGKPLTSVRVRLAVLPFTNLS